VAGFVPGIFMALAMSVTVHRVCRKMGYGARSGRASWREIGEAFRRAAFALALPVVVVGGIRFGYFTPTEAGAVAVVVTFVLGTLVYRELSFRDLPDVLAKTAVDSGVILLIVSFSAPVSWVLAYNQVPQQVAAFFASFGNSAPVFLLAVNVFLLLGGALMEGVTLLILVTPLLASVAARLGIDPIHFGMVVVMNVVLGAITPPVRPGRVLRLLDDEHPARVDLPGGVPLPAAAPPGARHRDLPSGNLPLDGSPLRAVAGRASVALARVPPGRAKPTGARWAGGHTATALCETDQGSHTEPIDHARRGQPAASQGGPGSEERRP
jgi:hypothetical protein